MNNSIPVEIAALKAALLFSPKADARAFLNGIRFERDADDLFIVSTDLNSLFAYRSVGAAHGIEFDPFTVPRSTVESAVRAADKKDNTLSLHPGRVPRLVCPSGASFEATELGSYSDWRLVVSNSLQKIAQGDVLSHGNYRADQVESIGKASRILNKSYTYSGVRIQNSLDNRTAIVSFGNIPALCILSPLVINPAFENLTKII